MSLEQNKLLVRRFYEEIINTGEVDRIESNMVVRPTCWARCSTSERSGS